MLRADLHTHSTASDGTLPPHEVIALAVEAGLDQLALTDHDTLDGYKRLDLSKLHGLRIINGIELSTSWSGIGVHIVGLNVGLDNATLGAGVGLHRQARIVRARGIAAILADAGLAIELEAVYTLAGGVPGRPHFARHLVEQGLIKDTKLAFKRHLGAGRPGDIKTGWAALETVIDWIHAAGGVATLAHPARYKLSRSKLRRLVDSFKEAGGDALEVVSGRQHTDVTAHLAGLSKTCKLLASCGSDFHVPGHSWSKIGMPLTLPSQCEPVWHSWE